MSTRTAAQSPFFALPGDIAAQNQVSLDHRDELALWEKPYRQGRAEHDHVKHLYRFVGNVECTVGETVFSMFSVNDDVIAWQYFWLRRYEPEIMDAFVQLVAGADHILDVGAYSGCYSLVAALNGCEVDAFEMVPRTVERLKINVYLNGVRDAVRMHQVGVSNRAGQVDISMPRSIDFLGTGNSVEAKSWVDSVDTTVCQLVRLDDWWRDQGSPKIDVIKLDVEEHEVEALEGAMDLLSTCRPHVIIEIEPANVEPISRTAAALGYHVEPLSPNNFHMSPT